MTQETLINTAPNQKYFMGVDEGGYDKETYAICVCGEDGAVIYLNQTKDKGFHKKEVQRLAARYDIPKWSILKEVNR